MKRTESFLQSAFYVLIIFVVVREAADSTYIFLNAHTTTLSGSSESLIKLTITVVIILALALLIASIEILLLDRSSTKYASVISSINRRLSTIVGDIDFNSKNKDYWTKIINELLKAVYESFLGNDNVFGKTFSTSIMGVDGVALKVEFYDTNDSLFEPNYRQYQYGEGEGFCGTAWKDNYPQSGRKFRLMRKDLRYSNNKDKNNKAKSYFSTVLYMQKRNRNERCIINISSDDKKDFRWYKKHAEALHFGLQPLISLLELCIERRDKSILMMHESEVTKNA